MKSTERKLRAELRAMMKQIGAKNLGCGVIGDLVDCPPLTDRVSSVLYSWARSTGPNPLSHVTAFVNILKSY